MAKPDKPTKPEPEPEPGFTVDDARPEYPDEWPPTGLPYQLALLAKVVEQEHPA